jgi:DNA-binding protein HU-beta
MGHGTVMFNGYYHEPVINFSSELAIDGKSTPATRSRLRVGMPGSLSPTTAFGDFVTLLESDHREQVAPNRPREIDMPPAKKAAPAAKKAAASSKAAPAKAVAQATVTLKHLAAALADSHDLAKRQAEAVLGDLVTLATKHLKKGDKIRLTGLGILQVRSRAARMGRNPATGEAIKIKASKKIAFRPAKELKEAV